MIIDVPDRREQEYRIKVVPPRGLWLNLRPRSQLGNLPLARSWSRHHFGVQHTGALDQEKVVKWSFESPKLTRQKFEIHERVEKSTPRRVLLPLPLEHLLTCHQQEIPVWGSHALQWLNNRSNISRNRTLERLGLRIIEARSEVRKTHREQNCIAALEVLVSFKSSIADSVLEKWLQTRPVAEAHLYLVAICRSLCSAGTARAVRFADLIIPVFEAVVEKSQLETEWGRRVGVEMFRSLAAISPEKTLGTACRHLSSIGKLEISAVLEAVLQALRTPGAQPTRVLTDEARRLWERYLSPESLRADNVPGVLARLLEILARCGHRLDDMLQTLQSHPLRPAVLFLFTRHGLKFANHEDRKRCFLEALRALKATNQMGSFHKLLQVAQQESNIIATEV